MAQSCEKLQSPFACAKSGATMYLNNPSPFTGERKQQGEAASKVDSDGLAWRGGLAIRWAT